MESLRSIHTNSPEQLQMFETPDSSEKVGAEHGEDYSLLVGHERTNGTFKSDEQLRTEYVRLTDNIVHRALEGVEVTDSATGEKTKRPVDYIVWLDKSARPLSWLTKKLWPVLAEDEQGNIPPRPQSRFVNIDRNQWADKIDDQGTGRVNVDSIDKSVIRSLRSIFLKNPNDRDNGLVEEIDVAPTIFDDKVILIVDEVRSSGRTLQYAERFFQRAFPEAHIDGMYWMGDMTTKDGAFGNADIPVWYSDKSQLGRGIGNRNIDLSRASGNRTQRLGAWFLSTRLREPDPSSLRLREEFKKLAEDVKSQKVLVEPSRDREEADYDERALRLNNVESFDDYLVKLQGLKEQSR